MSCGYPALEAVGLMVAGAAFYFACAYISYQWGRRRG